MITSEELGVKTANALLAELTIPSVLTEEGYPTNKQLEILEPVPSSGEFFSYHRNNKKIEPTKEYLLQDMFDDRQSIIAFCCASLQIDTRVSFDIDHVFPRESITEKQKLLLNYLNKKTPENDVFAKAFTGEESNNPVLKAKIIKYFKRDPSDNNKIKSTRWFFEVCYNNLSNLFHLKNYLNRGKSARTPKEWFKKIFPQKLLDAIQTKGGINEGVIMQQIFSKTALETVNLGKVKNKKGKEVGNDVIICLHEQVGIGLGEFVRIWFKENAQEIIANSKEIHGIKQKLIEMLEEDLRGSDNKREGLAKFLLTINEVLKVANIRDNLSRASSTDSDQAEQERKAITNDKILEAFDYMHSIKQIKKSILSIVEASDKHVVEQEFYKYCREQKLATLDSEGITDACDFLSRKSDELKSKGAVLTADEVVELLKNAKEAADPRVQLKEERRARAAETAELKRQLAAALAKQQVAAPQQNTLLLAHSVSLKNVTQELTSEDPEIESSHISKKSRSRSPSPKQ